MAIKTEKKKAKWGLLDQLKDPLAGITPKKSQPAQPVLTPVTPGTTYTTPRSSIQPNYKPPSEQEKLQGLNPKPIEDVYKTSPERPVLSMSDVLYAKQKEYLASKGFSSVQEYVDSINNPQKFANVQQQIKIHQQSLQQINDYGGWKKVAAVENLALNPFSKGKIDVDTGSSIGDWFVGGVAEHPYSTALTITGVVQAIKAIPGAIASITGKTAVQESEALGMFTEESYQELSGYAANTVTKKATASWLTKAFAAAKDPRFVVGTLMASIGSYPFAGFIKEEALQTIGFATSTAIRNGDLQAAQESISQTKEILNPGIFKQIVDKVPFANVVGNLRDFYKSASIQTAIYETIVNDMQDLQMSTMNNATPSASINQNNQSQDQSELTLWSLAKEKQNAQEIAIIDYYNSERKKLLEWEMEAQAEQRKEEALFWAKERKKQAELEKKEREAAAEFWLAYKKELQKLSNDSRPSNLNFGLL